MSFPIAIDTTQLTYPYFLIEGHYTEEDRLNFFPYGHTEENPRQPPRKDWDLEPGTYQFLIYFSYPGGIYPNPAVSFEVTAEGKVDYPADCDGFFIGRGTSTLTVVGCEVTINAEKLAGELGATLAPLPVPNNREPYFKHKTLRLMPATYRVHQGATPTESANFSLDLKRDGTFTYDPAFDIANGGFLAGLGTANLELIGYPIEIDATQLFYSSVWLPSVVSLKTDSPHTVNLLPDSYGFQVASGFYSLMWFDVTQQGTIDYSKNKHHSDFLSGQGTKTLTIRGYEVTLDARHLSPAGAAFWNMNDQLTRHRTIRMVPSNWHTMTQGFVTDALPLIRLGLDGKFDYGNLGKEGEVGPYADWPGFIPMFNYDVQPEPEANPVQPESEAKPKKPKKQRGFMAGRGTSTLTFYGYPVLIDASAVEDAGLGIVSLDGTRTEGSINLVNLLPSTYTLVLNGIHTSWEFKFKLDTEGELSFESALKGFLDIETLNGVPVLKVLAVLS